MGSCKASNCGAAAKNLTLCPPNPNVCTAQSRNATLALDVLRDAGGSKVATSMFVYCGLSINASGHLGSAKLSPGCAVMIPGLNHMGVGAEPVVGGSLSALRKMFASPSESISALVALTKAHKLRGISWDVEPSGSSASDAERFTAYLSQLRHALQPLGARVTAYSNAYSKMISNIALLSTAIDRVLDGDCYNGGSYKGWLAKYQKLLQPAVNRTAVAPAMMASTERGAWNCDNATIAQRYTKVVADGIDEIAIFTFDPVSTRGDCSSGWLPFARRFLAGH
jgi:hypothetical protein